MAGLPANCYTLLYFTLTFAVVVVVVVVVVLLLLLLLLRQL